MNLDFRTIQGYIDQQQGGSAGRGGDLVEFARTQAQELGVPVEIAEKLIRLESGGRADAVSPKGAFGPAQLMPGTAKELAAKYGGDPSDPYDNVRLGMHYLRDNYNQFGDWRLAAAAYQAGPGAVRRAGGIPNTTDGITRTPDYVRKVVPAGLGIGAMMPTPTVPRDSAPGAEPAAPMEEPDYSRFELLPTMRQGDAQPIYGLDDVTKQQAADAEQARLDALTLGDKAAMGFKKGAVQSVGLLGGLGAAVGDALDIESLQKAGMDLYTRQMEKAQEYSVAPSFTDVLDGKAEMSDWLAENIGYGVYQITEALATAGVGSLLLKGAMKPAAAGMMKGFVEREVVKTLASPIEAEARRLIAGGMAVEAARSAAEKTVAAKLGEQAIKAATEKAAKIAGATLAATANNFRQELGSIYGEAAENGTVDWEKILPAAAGATALDTLAEAYFGAKVLGTGGARSGGYASRLAKELPSQMVVQGGTEGGQSAIEQWGAGKEISGRQVVDEAAVGALMGGAGAPASAMQKAEEPIKPPAGVLGRAAEAGRSAGAMPADPNVPAGGGQGAAPAEDALPVGGVDERVRALLSKVQDGSGLLDRMRATDGFGPESATELLSAIAVARNPNMDPMQREAAAAGAERLLSLFEGRPNFTMPQDEAPAAGLPAVQQQRGGEVAVMPEPGATIDGEFSRYGGELADPAVPATRRLPPAAVRALPDPEKQRVLREAEAEYEQAFADLLKVEQLATSEQQLREAALARQYAEARLAEIQEAVAGAQAAYSAQVRRSLLDEILADPSTANPLERFEAEMRRQGYGEPAARPDEAARVQRFLDIREARPAEPEMEPSAPNEMDASALGVRERGARQSITPPARPSAPIQPLETGNVEAQERGNGGADAGVDQGVGRPGRGTEAGEALRADAAGEAVGVEGGGRGVDGVDQDTAVRTAGDVRQGVVAVDASGVAAAPLSGPSEASAPAPEDQDKRAELDVAADVTNTAPSEAQKEAGNYQKGRVVVQGFRVAIENPKGSVRRGVDKDGTEWSVVMPADYGYIERTEGADGDQVDVFIGDQPETGLIFVVNQNKPDSTRFDEHKVMLGFSSEDAAIDTYFDSFAGGFGQRLFHSIDGPHTAEELRALLPKLKKAKPVQEKVPTGEVVPAAVSGERADLRPELEALIRMKAGARQIGKEDALQTVIDRAKSYMQGGTVEPGVFLVRSKQFKDMPVVQQTIAGIVDKIKTARAPAQGDSPVAEQPAADVRSAAERSAEPEAPAAEPAPAAAAEPEVRNPRTFDEFIGDVDAGYRAHFDYAGADGTTIWIEQTDKGWVVKQKDDDSSAVITKGGAGAGGGWGKLGALTAAKNLASYRFKEWKPVVAETSAQNERKAESGKSDYENDPYEREAARMEVRPIEGSDEFIVGYRADNGWHNFIRFALSEKTGRPVRVEYFYEHQSGRVPAKMALDRWVEGRKQAGSRQDSGKSEQQAPLASTASRQGAQPSANTIFTEDAAAKAREVLRRKLGQVNTGLDPEILQAGITLAGYHIEKGARKFAAYARAMLDDMGDAVKPYLKSWYMGVKYDPRAAAFTGDMSSAADVDAADVDSLGERAPAPVEVEGISKILERIDGDNGMYVNIAKSTSRAGGFNVMLRDGDAEETVSGLVNIPTLEQARTKANEMLGIKDAPAAAIDEKQQQADAVADAIGKAIAASPVIVEHVTGKGKTIRGIVRTDLTKDEAKKIDPYTFRKDDGYFIREKYLDGMAVPPAAQKTQIEPGDIPPAFLRKHMVTTRVFVESEGAEVDVEMPADKALQLLADELERLRGVRACVEG